MVETYSAHRTHPRSKLQQQQQAVSAQQQPDAVLQVQPVQTCRASFDPDDDQDAYDAEWEGLCSRFRIATVMDHDLGMAASHLMQVSERDEGSTLPHNECLHHVIQL